MKESRLQDRQGQTTETQDSKLLASRARCRGVEPDLTHGEGGLEYRESGAGVALNGSGSGSSCRARGLSSEKWNSSGTVGATDSGGRQRMRNSER